MKNKNKMILIIVIAALLGFVFYWYSYRPSQVVQECSSEAKEKAVEKLDLDDKYNKSDRDAYYKWCLQERGFTE